MAWTRTWRRTVEEDVKGKDCCVAEEDAEQNPGGCSTDI